MEEHPKQSLWDPPKITPTTLQLSLCTSFRCPAPQSHPTTPSSQDAMLSLASMSPHVLFPLSEMALACPSAKLRKKLRPNSMQEEVVQSQDRGYT